MAWQLGLSAEEFFRLTPRQFHLLLDQRREKVKHQELLAGIVASTIANWSMKSPSRPLTPADFMPSHRAEAPVKQKRINRKKVDQDIRALMEAAIRTQNG